MTSLISKNLKKYKIRPSKRMGQNFLIDKGVLRKIIEAGDLSPEDVVLEIGPGLGILTLELAKKVKKVIAVEKDRTLYQILEGILQGRKINNVKLINADILKIQDSKLKIQNYKLLANLPYYISSPIIRKFLETKEKPELMVLMVQKEVAQRICAKPGEMSLLSVSVQFYSQPKIITYVSKKSFYPQPKVDSAILKIIPKLIPKIDSQKFFQIVKIGFSSKRKMLINNLSKKLKMAEPPQAYQKSKIKNLFKKMGINPKIRAENLSIKDWLKLFHEFYSP
jgi:16S rRNA (adenine1518-N6/adenine1519-N6)-dimethyltransferase